MGAFDVEELTDEDASSIAATIKRAADVYSTPLYATMSKACITQVMPKACITQVNARMMCMPYLVQGLHLSGNACMMCMPYLVQGVHQLGNARMMCMLPRFTLPRPRLASLRYCLHGYG
jgi:hypothetical protein